MSPPGGESRRGMEAGPGPRTARRRNASQVVLRSPVIGAASRQRLENVEGDLARLFASRALALNQSHHRVRTSADSCRQNELD